MRGQCLKPLLTPLMKTVNWVGCVGGRCSLWVRCEEVFCTPPGWPGVLPFIFLSLGDGCSWGLGPRHKLPRSLTTRWRSCSNDVAGALYAPFLGRVPGVGVPLVPLAWGTPWTCSGPGHVVLGK